MDDLMTPPMTSRSRSSSTSSFDESYFFKTYVPLSNLPTPPPSSHSNSSCPPAPGNLLFLGETLDHDLLGPATHLTNLIPSATSLTVASVPLVHAILTRTHLPLEIIALAVCILDSLSSRFALSWRQGCPLITPHPPAPFSLSEEREEVQHIDSIHPELIVLAALVLATKFLDDRQRTTREYAGNWGRGFWSCEQVNFTERCILENLQFRLLSLNQYIIDALEDMERAGRQVSPEIRADEDWDTDTCFGSFGGNKSAQKSMGCGRTVLDLDSELTPAEASMVKDSLVAEVESSEIGSQQQNLPASLSGTVETPSLSTIIP
ncbi:Uncharacterized protein BP5553_07979 [Venustampulla echinocandica]|uniref:Uncharacterized protein n=1 Tax=Venustampulla echinocandica TaxID=2656787 RepID=A0A370TFF7_9HELO|nr:Uncharacterized protein BP5553_07979 [Venustampulla echinocandica]RDL33611.1 Uncharacterized protein BP5553_07979 [Venustampulla echinocandica]